MFRILIDSRIIILVLTSSPIDAYWYRQKSSKIISTCVVKENTIVITSIPSNTDRDTIRAHIGYKESKKKREIYSFTIAFYEYHDNAIEG